ncbi:MAG TPA: divergent polysaccharide deacetylase family protein [Bauldia sp.]|nr:divergent polysaccharide deacetylase family protein [Bauldia sp.]
MKDDLVKPLGIRPKPRLRQQPLYIAAGAVAAIAMLGVAAWTLMPAAKSPTATAVINAPPVAKPAPLGTERTGSTVPADTAPLTDMKPTGGLTEVGGSNEVIIHAPGDDGPIQLAALPENDLVEKTPVGLLPRVAPSGTRPLDAYARPGVSDPNGEMRIAIVVGGLGLDPDGTREAIAELPGTVTLAFAPYGDNLPADTAAARSTGHELLLQIPLEPFNYPQTNPGQNTLTSNATADENIGRLHWLMARMTNYVGVVNYMGAKFTSDIGPLAPVMRDIGQRGLMYVDDGSSTRSRAAEVAGTTTPFVRADLVLDADLSAEAIDQSLSQLRAIARERGYAVATATAFPITIERIAEFAKQAANKGITLVPISALAENHS